MHQQHSNRTWRRRLFALALTPGLALALTGCSGSRVLETSPVARTLRLPATLRERAEERKLRKAVEADNFPPANEHGL